jgi:two-component system, NtrC family, response regulator HydG
LIDEGPLEIVADRFVRGPDRTTIDLATGAASLVKMLAPAAKPEELVWSERSAVLMSLCHPSLIELIDFGFVGPNGRFEAFRLQGPLRRWSGRDAQTGAVLRSVVSFLHGCGRSAGALEWSRVFEQGGRPALLADELTGCILRASDTESVSPGTPGCESRALSGLLQSCRSDSRARARARTRNRQDGVVIQATRLPAIVGGLLEAGESGRPRRINLYAPPGSGGSTALLSIAREARLRGFVPVSTAALANATRPWLTVRELLPMIAERHVLILHDGRQTDASIAVVLAELLMALAPGGRPHFVLVRQCARQHPFIELERFSVVALTRMLGGKSRFGELAVRRALRMAQGRPGLFLRSLHTRQQSAQYRGQLLAAETTGPYTARTRTSQEPGEEAEVTSGNFPRACSVGDPSAFARAENHIASGWRLVLAGRHAAGERLLRDALGGFVRRGLRRPAAVAALRLGRAFLDRGRTDRALDCFEAARDHFQAARHTAGALRASIYGGLARTDSGEFVSAEATLRAALIAAEQLSDGEGERFARLALVRCLYWQAKYEEAGLTLEAPEPSAPSVALRWEGAALRDAVVRCTDSRVTDYSNVADVGSDPTEAEPDAAVTTRALSTRLALACRDFAAATASGLSGVERALALDRPLDICVARTALAGVHAWAGNYEALEEQVQQGLLAAKAIHSPLRVLRLRLALLEGLVQAGRHAEARNLARRLERAKLERLPALLGERLRGAIADARSPLPSRQPSVSAVSCRPVLVGGARAPRGRLVGSSPFAVNEIVEILQLFQDLQDEPRALESCCSNLRKRLRALEVIVSGLVSGSACVLAAFPSCSKPSAVAERSIQTGLFIPHGRFCDGTHAAAPIRYGGETIGALACRWAPDTALDLGYSEAQVTTAAAAAAPLVRSAIDRLAMPQPERAGIEAELIGRSGVMVDVRQMISRAAAVPFPVIVQGESGTGKELIARAIHRSSPRRAVKYRALNCAAINDELIDSELFGHARGAFTGAVSERVGLFEEADGGTLFLDEVAELSPRAQAKLLRAIQEGEIRRVGESFSRSVDVRLVAATNRLLESEVENGTFRRDLLYRLDVVRISVPPLRERVEDIPLLAAHFWKRASDLVGCRATLGPSMVSALCRYDWPGNVRELQNVMSVLAVSAPRRGSVPLDNLPEALARTSSPQRSRTLGEARTRFESAFVSAALARAGGNQARAAADVGLSRQGFAKLMARLKLDEPSIEVVGGSGAVKT